jgi:hypothetical protein
MRVFGIAAGTHKGKQIHVTKYVRTARGMDIKVEHNVPVVAGKELQWIQTVTSNSKNFNLACKKLTTVDPFAPADASHTVSLPAVPGTCKADDALPFYWTTAELATVGSGFSDGPSESVPAAGRTWTQFVLSLTEVKDKAVSNLVAIYWGYDLMASGEVRAAAIHRATADELKRHFKALRDMYPDFTYS